MSSSGGVRRAPTVGSGASAPRVVPQSVDPYRKAAALSADVWAKEALPPLPDRESDKDKDREVLVDREKERPPASDEQHQQHQQHA